MGRHAGLLLGVGLLLTVQLATTTGLYLLWVHDVRRSR